jgi:hypothetical protein
MRWWQWKKRRQAELALWQEAAHGSPPDERTQAYSALRKAEDRLARAPEGELKEAARDWQRARRRVDDARLGAGRAAADPPEGKMFVRTIGVVFLVHDGIEFVTSLLPRRRRRR